MSKFLDDFTAARKVSTPLIAVRTPDPAATIAAIAEITAKDFKDAALLRWDCVRGITAVNRESEPIADNMMKGDQEATGNPVTALHVAEMLPENGILFLLNIHRLYPELPVMQAIWNLRDLYKQRHSTLVILAPEMTIPPEL